MAVNECLDKKLRVLRNLQFKSIEDETRKIYNKKTTFIYLVDINQD